MTVELLAPAKLNLALHVTGRRADGLHLLDSFVVFADLGDWLTIAPSGHDRLEVTGPFAAGVPTGPENLIWKAAQLFPDRPPLDVRLDKRLPAAAGIGGGSADAAAVIRALSRLMGRALPDRGQVLTIGADLPVCLAGRACRMRGIGEQLEPLCPPGLHAVLVNPGRPVPTAAVFAGLASRENAAMTAPPRSRDAGEWLDWLAGQRNDLTDAAVRVAPEIGAVLRTLAAIPGLRLARMSGSGATCIGLFDNAHGARDAASRLARDHPHWWSAVARLGDACGASRAGQGSPAA